MLFRSPKGSDAGFSEKFSSQHAKSALLKRVKGMSAAQGFALQHFAGEVGYSTASWLDKNKDPLSEDLQVLLRGSSEPLIVKLFAPPAAAEKESEPREKKGKKCQRKPEPPVEKGRRAPAPRPPSP